MGYRSAYSVLKVSKCCHGECDGHSKSCYCCNARSLNHLSYIMRNII